MHNERNERTVDAMCEALTDWLTTDMSEDGATTTERQCYEDGFYAGVDFATGELDHDHVGFTCVEIHEMWLSQRDRAITAESDLAAARAVIEQVRSYAMQLEEEDCTVDSADVADDLLANLPESTP